MQPCTANGCAGTFDLYSNQAHCRGNFAGCQCLPVIIDSCGAAQSCEANGCGGTVDDGSSDRASCKNFYQGCPCIASSATPGYCNLDQPCSTVGCVQTGSGDFGYCSDGCSCLNPQPGGPTTYPPPPPDGCPGCSGQPPAGWNPNPLLCGLGACEYTLPSGMNIGCHCVCNNGQQSLGVGPGFTGQSCSLDLGSWAWAALDVLCELFPENLWLNCY